MATARLRSGDLAQAHRHLLLAAPGELRERLDLLPQRLGISADRGGWGDYATLAPIVSLPTFFPLKADPEAVLQAHRLAGFWGLASDRAADGQAAVECHEELEFLRAQWASGLIPCLGLAEAERIVGRAAELLKLGLAEERAQRLTQALTLDEYAQVLWLRTTWFGATALSSVPLGVRETLERGLQWLMLSLQLLDDACDEAEDIKLHGVSMPALLHLSPGEMKALSAHFAMTAGRCFAEADADALSIWCGVRAAELWNACSPALRLTAPLLFFSLGTLALEPVCYWAAT